MQLEPQSKPGSLSLLVGRVRKLPDELEGTAIVLSAGMTEQDRERLVRPIDGQLEDRGPLEWAVAFVCAASALDAVGHTRAAWQELGGDGIQLETLCDTTRLLVRKYRKMLDVMQDGDVLVTGLPMGFAEGSSAGWEQAKRVVKAAATRRPWQVWR